MLFPFPAADIFAKHFQEVPSSKFPQSHTSLDSCFTQGLLFPLFKGGFKVSSGTVQWYRVSYGNDLDDSDTAGPVTPASDECNYGFSAQMIGVYVGWLPRRYLDSPVDGNNRPLSHYTPK